MDGRAGARDPSRRVGKGDAVTPWVRGERARPARPLVRTALDDVLVDFALTRAEGRRADDVVDFETDAGTLVTLPMCRRWVSDVVEAGGGVACGDAEAALVSVYVEVVLERFGTLTLAWVRDLARRLRPGLRRVLGTLGVPTCRDREELDRTVLEPLAWFFLESVRTLECDPNRLRPENAPEVVGRPYGWSPGSDHLDGSLRLLLTRQTRRRYWSHAFTFSPLGYWLRTCGLVQLVRLDDGGSRGSRLVASRCLEDGLRETVSADARGASRPRASGPGRRLEDAESLQRARDIARTRARALWAQTLEGANVRKLAVLLTLAGLEGVPDHAPLRNPPDHWLDTLVRTLLGDAPHRSVIARIARRLVDMLSGRLRVSRPVATLTPDYASTVLSRLREVLFG